MASTYTNSGIEKIGSGEQAGTWGTTTNNNLDIIDNSINGVKTLTLSGTSQTFTVVDGAVSDSGAKVLILGGSPSGTHTLTLAPEDADKVHLVQNSSGQTVNISQGSGGNASLINGEIAWIFCDGAGSGAAVTKQSISSSPAAFTVGTDLTVTGDASIGDDLSLASDAAVLKFGANSEVTITHVHDTGILINDARELRFRDADLKILSSTDGQLDVGADTEIAITAPVVDIDASTSVNISNDLKLDSDSAVISFGADSEVKITHVADTGLNIKHTATADDKPIVLTLQTGETDIAANDVIGAINFQAPDESTGTDAILVAAGIEAVSEGDFAADNNATKLSFKTGASEAASEKMTLGSSGNLVVSGTVTASSFTGVTDISMSAKVTVGSSTASLTASVNVDSVTDNGTGDFTIVIATDYSNANYAATITTFDDDGTSRNVGDNTVHAQAEGTLQIKTYRATPSEVSVRGAFDPDGFFVMSNAQ
jgi:hypothetical protein